MTKQNNTAKPGRIRHYVGWVLNILRLLFIVLLALFLITCLYCQAPPKVLTLVAIILATLTIIPKRTRKWIWLTFAIIVLGLIIWVFLPEDNDDWRPYTFDEELAALEAKRAIPDEQNAATIYKKIIETYDVNDFKHDFIDDDLWELSRKEPWSTQDYPELANWLNGRKETITILMQACERDLCRFPLRPDMLGLEDTTDRLSPMRDWAKLLVRTGSNNIGDGDIDEGVRKYICVLRIAEHAYQQSSILELVTAISIEALGRSQITRFLVLGDATEERLRLLDKSLSKIHHDWVSDWSKILKYEKLFAKNFLAMTFYEVNSKGKARFARDPMALMRQEFKGRGYELPPRTHWYKKFGKLRAILAWLYMPHSPHEAGEIFDDSYEKYYAMAEPDFDWQKVLVKPKLRLKFNYRYMIEMIAQTAGGSYYSIYDLYLRNISDNRAAQLIIALRRYKNKHGNWPETLQDIKSLAPPELFVDPINNDSFVYRLTDDGFTLYSKGKNNIDENGDRRTKKPDGTYTDDFLIWPPKSRKAK